MAATLGQHSTSDRNTSDIEWFLEGQEEISALAADERRSRPRIKRSRALPFFGSLGRLIASFAIAAVVLGVLALIISWAAIYDASQDLVFTDAADLAPANVVIVPGALVFDDGQPSKMLSDRVDAAVALYDEGTVPHLLVSGDNSVERYNEPVAMREHALAQQVPAEHITLDYAGVDTWDTCVRARDQFGVTSAIVVTQKLYASRTAALCDAAGIDVAVLAIDPPPLRTRTLWLGRAREPLAKVKAATDLIRTPSPQFGGERIGLVGSVGMPEGGHPPDWNWQTNAAAE